MTSPTPLEPEYDVVIVGGRVAGASLASRLGAAGVRTLVFDRARFPSLPGVPSCAMVYPPTLALLDELNIDEAAYSDDSARARRFMIEFDGYFDTRIDMIEVYGRNYGRGIDRDRFDYALWQSLGAHESVTRREGLSLVDLLYDESRAVVGVTVREAGRALKVRASCVIGADGRFSTMARKVGARVREDRSQRTSTAHYATWEGVQSVPGEPDPMLHVITSGRGGEVLMFPMPEHRTIVTTHLRSDRVTLGGDVEGFYRRALRASPGASRRLEGARCISRVVGLKRIGNRYLQAGGPGWALCGDALHHKDPIDGQGIYDALFGTKALAEALLRWHHGTIDWAQALAEYDRAVMDETHEMFVATTDRLAQELYGNPPAIVIKTLLRWMLQDPEYGRRFLLYLNRQISAKGWLSPSLVVGSVARGVLGDLRGMLGGRRA